MQGLIKSIRGNKVSKNILSLSVMKYCDSRNGFKNEYFGEELHEKIGEMCKENALIMGEIKSIKMRLDNMEHQLLSISK